MTKYPYPMENARYKTGESVEFGDILKRDRYIGVVQGWNPAMGVLLVHWRIQPDIWLPSLEEISSDNAIFVERYSNRYFE